MIHWTLLQLLGAVPGQREIFEKICLEIIKVEHPNARSIREDRGDHGIDIYVGDFDNGIHIYQAKFFRDAIGESQRSQIRASYNRILDVETDVKSWTLMVPLEFSFDEITWFETWEKKKAHEIRLMSGLQLEEKVRRPGYEEARKILSDALLSAGIQIQWFKRPTPVLKAKFTAHDPHRSPDYRLVRVEIHLENRGEKSIRNPKIRIQYTDPGVAALSEYAPWTRSHPIESLNPRTLELSRIIRPGEQSPVLPIDYRLKNFETIGIQCQIFMDDERPAQTGITIARQELTEGRWNEKVGEENYFPSLDVFHHCSPREYLSPEANEVLGLIINGSETASERGITVTYQYSNNEVIHYLFHTHAGTTVPVRRAALESALPELVQLGFLRELEKNYGCVKYRLVEEAI